MSYQTKNKHIHYKILKGLHFEKFKLSLFYLVLETF